MLRLSYTFYMVDQLDYLFDYIVDISLDLISLHYQLQDLSTSREDK